MYKGVVLPTDPRITLRFGATTSPYSPGNPHKGLDFSPRPGNDDIGMPIRNAVEGTVQLTSTGNSGYGNHVMVACRLPFIVTARDLQKRVRSIPANQMFYCIYAHLNRIDVKIGQKLDPGAILGTLGNTGYSDYAHLHFEIRINAYANREVIDPADFFHMTVVGFGQEARYV